MKLSGLFKKKTVRNAGWIVGGRLTNKVLSFLVGVLTARYLGPGNYGLIGYVTAYITFFSALSNLGLNSVIIKEFADNPQDEGLAMGTTMGLRAVSSLLSAVMIVGVVAVADGGDKTTIIVAMLSSMGLLFQIFDVLKKWFQSRLQSKYAAIATVISYGVISAYKIILLMTAKSVEWFALSTALEYCVEAIFLLAVYKKHNGPKFGFSWEKGKNLLRASSGYIVSAVMVSVYASTDRLMLKHMLDDASVGYYTLSVTLSNIWVFLLEAVIDSMYPTVVQAHGKDKALFEQRNRQLYAIVLYLAVAVSAGICLLANPLVSVLYGKEYLPAVAPLRVVVWYTAFSYLGVARNPWMVCENKQKYLPSLYFGAAVINVILNWAMIPLWGPTGAALASLITQISTTVILPALIPPLRPNAKLMIEALLLKDVFPKK